MGWRWWNEPELRRHLQNTCLWRSQSPKTRTVGLGRERGQKDKWGRKEGEEQGREENGVWAGGRNNVRKVVEKTETQRKARAVRRGK